ncbi:hypothetical protein M0804_012755 [Polistes exclamans]|nr:hypothetical protein M0804_012755 [Polistes exclamans]
MGCFDTGVPYNQPALVFMVESDPSLLVPCETTWIVGTLSRVLGYGLSVLYDKVVVVVVIVVVISLWEQQRWDTPWHRKTVIME